MSALSTSQSNNGGASRSFRQPDNLSEAKASTSPGASIAIRNVSKSYPRRHQEPLPVVSDVSADIKPGEFVVLLGPSGCGKTTLTMMLSGLVPFSSGSISVDGEEVRDSYSDLGVVFQNPTLLPWKTVLENVMLQADVRGLPKSKYRDRARELLAKSGLGGFESAFPSQLSGGMQQRVSLARCLLHRPRLIVMDEPFGALDALTREQMNIDLQRHYLAEGSTVVFVTHSIPEAVFLADRIFLMAKRPTYVERIVEVPLPRPRLMNHQESEEFVSLVHELRAAFYSSGVLSE